LFPSTETRHAIVKVEALAPGAAWTAMVWAIWTPIR
jgi:hypothetical protein